MERETTRAGRAGIVTPPSLFETRYTTLDGMWAESREVRAERLSRAACRDKLLDWVRARLPQLRQAQRVSIELHYFEGLTYEQAGKRLGRDPGTVKRAEKRAVRALRALKRADDSWILYSELYRFGVLKHCPKR